MSDILDPVVRKIISTEDMVARAEILNKTNVGWSETSYWGGLSLVKYVQGRRVMCGREINQYA